LTVQEKEARSHRHHYDNLNGNDLKPLLREQFRPFLKASGFRRVSDSLSVRIVEPHYVHCLRLSFSSVYAGRFHVRGGIALDMLPMSDGSEFNLKRLSVDTDCLLTNDITLPNGNPEFDNGKNLEEAAETIEYLIASVGDFDREYFSRFEHFPEPLSGFGIDFVRNLDASIRNGKRSTYGSWGATIEMLTFRLALVHRFLENIPTSRQVLEYLLANLELCALKEKCGRLLREMERSPARRRRTNG
jgi:hypothetical protein